MVRKRAAELDSAVVARVSATAPRTPSIAPGARAALALQRSVGNRAATAFFVQRAGAPRQMDEPDGLAEINMQPPPRYSILGPAGRTQALDDFQAPRLEISIAAAGPRGGGFVARAQPTSSRDSVHRSWYPGPGRHRQGAVLRGGQRRESFYFIPPAQSVLIRRGEQEHLNDHLRAYQLSYERLATVINSVARREFSGASEQAARAAVLADFRRRLTRLGMQAFHDPASWHDNLIALLRLSSARDNNGWHTLQPGRPRVVRGVDVTPLVPGPDFRIGRSSASVVSYRAMSRARR